MKLEDIKTSVEIKECIEAYSKLNDYSFLPGDKDFLFKNLSLAIRRKRFFKLLKENDKIVAWLYADVSNSLHIKEKILQQYYYYSSLSGVKSFRAIQLFHEELLSYAAKNNYTLVISTGSHLDEKYVFTRMLEKLGWDRRGYIACKRPD